MYKVILNKLTKQFASHFPPQDGIPRSLQEQHDHAQAIQRIIDRWQQGQLSIEEKRRLVSRENRSYHGVG